MIPGTKFMLPLAALAALAGLGCGAPHVLIGTWEGRRTDVFMDDPANPVTEDLRRVTLTLRADGVFELVDLTVPHKGYWKAAGPSEMEMTPDTIMGKPLDGPPPSVPIRLTLREDGKAEFIDRAGGMVAPVEMSRSVSPAAGAER